MSAPIPTRNQDVPVVQSPLQPLKETQRIFQRTLLQVEDNRANAELVEQLIARRDDLKLLTAVNGEQGIEMARTYLPDVILMDMRMQGIDGHGAFKILHEDPATARIPVIAISSNAYKTEIADCLEAGFFSYVTKPFKLDALMGSIDGALLYAQTLLAAQKPDLLAQRDIPAPLARSNASVDGESMKTSAKPIPEEPLCIGIEPVDEKRLELEKLVSQLDVDPKADINSEYFLGHFAKLQVVLAEFFAREEEVIGLIGLPGSEMRKHFVEHDRLLNIFNQIYFDSMEHKTTMATEVYRMLKAEIAQHIKGYDVKLRDVINARHGIAGS